MEGQKKYDLILKLKGMWEQGHLSNTDKEVLAGMLDSGTSCIRLGDLVRCIMKTQDTLRSHRHHVEMTAKYLEEIESKLARIPELINDDCEELSSELDEIPELVEDPKAARLCESKPDEACGCSICVSKATETVSEDSAIAQDLVIIELIKLLSDPSNTRPMMDTIYGQIERRKSIIQMTREEHTRYLKEVLDCSCSICTRIATRGGPL